MRNRSLARTMRHALLGLALCLPMAKPVSAKQTAAATAHLRLTIVLVRHGIRAPTQPGSALDRDSALPWPHWPVGAGQLTPHGRAGMQALGARYRALFAPSLGLAASGCAGTEQIVTIADSTARNHASAQALLQGMAPGCAVHYQALPEGERNALFEGGKAPAPPVRLEAETRAQLAHLQAVLSGCQHGRCAAPPPARLLYEPATRDGSPAAASTLKLAGGLAENLMLEDVEGFDAAQLGWGQVDRAAVAQLIALHNTSFAQSKRPLPVATAAALAPSSTRLLVLVGHDTNLATLGGLLGVQWHRSDRPDDYPPGGALVLDLLERDGAPLLRVRTLMPGLSALRSGRLDDEALASSTLVLPGCHGQALCPLPVALAWLRTRIDPARVQVALPAMQSWPVPP
ncbi:histidine-type phosphatase [Xanthomonas citri]|uniref:histidine-type phosphatase n=1 Tax=Xanthomonas citri TaxID=346 RepID=UPI00030DE4E2|nr:histidine-type phosphatase [Xanthomonas citri]AMU97169.1 6-phytase [Xanthomonas citri pv. aurantifolii]AMV01518.1 6-phytase [Xanthomonas citri pv. aurantifolii]MCC8490987.1 histidine-type phosphatase [Xanthomonas citri pv. fuscans]TBW95779.1 6-phytase [Xanthomonas citri pv. aurantifolii]TBW99915.1 6-phytase [Xanthomonas citri pv. aurantifolii]